MTHPDPQTYIYDPEVVDTLSSEVEALGLEIPRDPNSPDYAAFMEQLRAKNPGLATRVSLARIPESEVRASALLQEQARAIDGRESFVERITARVTRRTPNGAPVPDARRLGIIGAGLLIGTLGAFMFWPRQPKTVTASATATPPGAAQSENVQAGSDTESAGGPPRLPTEPVETSPLAPAPGSSTGSTPGIGTGQTVAPTESQVTAPSYTAPSYANDTSSSYSPPPSSPSVYTPPPAVNSSTASTPPAMSSATPDTTAAPDDTAAPEVFTPPPAASISAATPEPDWSTVYTPPVSVDTPPPAVNSTTASTPPAVSSATPDTTAAPDDTAAPVVFTPPPAASISAATPGPDSNTASTPPVTVTPTTPPPVQVSENFAGSQLNSAATSPATAAGPTSPSGRAGGAASGLHVAYTAANGQQGEGQRTGRMAVLSVRGADAGNEASTASAGSGQGAEGAGNSTGGANDARSRNLKVIYDAKATNRITSSGTGQNQNQGQSGTQAQAPQNGQTTETGSTSSTPPPQAQDGRSKVLYSAPEQASAAPVAQGNGQASSSAPASASPFQMGQLIPANMVVALDLIEGAGVEFFVNTPAAQGNYVWKGTATLDGSKRVQMNFTELALPDGQVVPVRASGVATDGTLGVKPGFRPSAPAAAIDAVRGTLSGVQEAANAQLQAGTTVVTGGATVVTKAPPNFWLSLLGGAVNSFKLPSTTASVVTLAHIDRGTPINVLFGGSVAGDGAPR
ncbi:hypothetical protein [Deinococcus budaensis]|uniref:Uncharacterized protein n=1 Tax=Deinococcus budaensis TaxID=1665626 RepID=A0A7W8GFC0_9DEIO|nr:hypothetical protein [Deinococcus budaensis]MBB5234196.1 hypothetical protein [Deinococcus budaensis]